MPITSEKPTFLSAFAAYGGMWILSLLFALLVGIAIANYYASKDRSTCDAAVFACMRDSGWSLEKMCRAITDR